MECNLSGKHYFAMTQSNLDCLECNDQERQVIGLLMYQAG